MKNQVIDKSKCCNANVMVYSQSVADFIVKIPPQYSCRQCGKSCEVNTLPAFEEVSKGIYRPINR